MFSEWRCGECKETGAIEDPAIHGPRLLFAIRKQHRSLSPDCRIEDPVFYPTGPLAPEKRRWFLDQIATTRVAEVEAAAQAKLLEPTFVATAKNEIVWLDCQLGTDAESVEIAKSLESLKERMTEALSGAA